MWRYVKWLVGLDTEKKVPQSIERLALRVVATRELVGAYHTHDEEETSVKQWDDPSGYRNQSPEEVADDYMGRGQTPPGVSAYSPDPLRPVRHDVIQAFIDDRPIGYGITIEEADETTQPDGATSAITPEEAVRAAFEQYRNSPLVKQALAANATVVAAAGAPSVRPAATAAATVAHQSYAKTQRPERRSDADRSRIVRMASAAAKRKFGLPKCTEANMLVVGKAVRDWLEEKGVRPTHIEHIAPLATAAVFVPTRADIEARAILASSTVVGLRAEYDATYFSDAPRAWYRPSTWFGRAYARPFTG